MDAPTWGVQCPCCEGVGEHEVRPFLSMSPYDYILRCDFCLGVGKVSTSYARRYRSGTICTRRR